MYDIHAGLNQKGCLKTSKKIKILGLEMLMEWEPDKRPEI